MSDLIFAVPTNPLPARDLRRLFAIANFAEELHQCLERLLTDTDWTRADQRISEIQTELAPLLAEHRRRFPDRDSQAPALWSHRDPFDGDARVIARAAGTDDPDAYPIIAFL
jgi:hypothetical protein